jgi:hypothetical protein
MTRLLPCTQCSRHVRKTEEACPFCGAPLGASFAATPARPAAPSGLGRAALFAFASTAVVACSGEDDAQPVHGGSPVPVAGAGNTSGGATAAGGKSSGGGTTNTGGVTAAGGAGGIGAGGMLGPVYGAPITPDPVDAAADADDTPAPMGSGGGAHALYGLPPSPSPKK